MSGPKVSLYYNNINDRTAAQARQRTAPISRHFLHLSCLQHLQPWTPQTFSQTFGSTFNGFSFLNI